MIVGESPGANELAKGMPFVGPSGRMLMDVLKEGGYDEKVHPEPYVINALQCYPSGDKQQVLAGATEACKGRVLEQIGAHPRKVILALGAAASWATTGDFGLRVTRDRGKVLASPLAEQGVVITVHPAYLMRNGAGLPFWKKDLRSAIELLDGRYTRIWAEPQWLAIESREGLESLVNSYVSTGGVVTGDLETDSLNQFMGRMLSLGITRGDGRLVHIIPEEIIYDNWDLMQVLMEAKSIQWNWHNGKFDVRWFWHGPSNGKGLSRIDARVDEDTLLASYALNSNKGFHDLDQVAQAWINAPAHKGAIDKYLPNRNTSYRAVPRPELFKYQAFDVSKTHQMLPALKRGLEADGPKTPALYKNILVPSSMFFARIEEYGVEVDLDIVRQNLATENAEIDAITAQLQVFAHEYMGKDINFGSYIQLRELMFKHMQLGHKGASWRTQASDEKAIIELQRKHNHPLLHTLLNHREVVKRRGTYVIPLLPPEERLTKAQQARPNLIDSDSRVRASYKVHGTTTGRPACTEPNMLNVPRGPMIRGQYKAKPGKIFVEIDLNQAELRSLAQESKDPTLVKIYTENTTSIHDVTTSAFYGSKEQMKSDPSILAAAMAQLQYFGEPDPVRVYAEAKMRGKATNFGIVYGREAHSLAQEFNISFQEAQRWIETWFATYPGAHEYILKCRATVRKNQTMVTPFGRKKRVGVWTLEKLNALENEAANFPHQSIASDIMLLSAMEVEFPLRERWDAYIWNEVYDAIYLEMDADDQKINEAVSYVQDVITRVPRDYGLVTVPFLGDAKVGFTWGAMKDWKGSIASSLDLPVAA